MNVYIKQDAHSFEGNYDGVLTNNGILCQFLRVIEFQMCPSFVHVDILEVHICSLIKEVNEKHSSP